MGGAIAEGNVTPAAEFNIWVDPEAAAPVFASDIDVTMVGLDVTDCALMTARACRAAQGSGPGRDDGRGALDLLRPAAHAPTTSSPGTPVHAALSIAHAISGDFLEQRYRNVEIVCASGAMPRPAIDPPVADQPPRAERACRRRGRGAPPSSTSCSSESAPG